MKFLHKRDEQLELALGDVFLLPGYWEGGSRRTVDLTPRDFRIGSNPLMGANMNAVSGARLCEVLARLGGLGVLPQDIPPDKLREIIRRILEADPIYDTALTIGPDAPIKDVLPIIYKRSANLVIVVDSKGKPIGVISPDDMKDKDAFTRASVVMTKVVVKLRVGWPPEKCYETLLHHNIKAAPVVDRLGNLVGTLSRQDILVQRLVQPTLVDGRLAVAVAVGINGQPAVRAREALSFGAAVLVLDTAHGDQRKMIEAIRAVRDEVGSEPVIVAGNVCTAEGTERLLTAGADGVKVNVGPGAMCTTRMVTGAGRPTFSAVRACAEVARAMGKFAWADGGVKDPRDLSLYIAAGATRVMCGTLFAPTFESAADVQVDPEGALFVSNFGMASARAVRDRNGGLSELEAAVRGLYQEGISSSQVYLRPGRESVGQIVTEFLTGLQSACTYVGASGLEEMHQKAVVGVQTHAGFHEGTPHGKVRR